MGIDQRFKLAEAGGKSLQIGERTTLKKNSSCEKEKKGKRKRRTSLGNRAVLKINFITVALKMLIYSIQICKMLYLPEDRIFKKLLP